MRVDRATLDGDHIKISLKAHPGKPRTKSAWLVYELVKMTLLPADIVESLLAGYLCMVDLIFFIHAVEVG